MSEHTASHPANVAGRRNPCPSRPALAVPCSACGAREFNVCEPLDEERQAKLLALAARLRWDKRQTIFRAGDDARHLYNITEGTVSISRTLPDGRRQIFGFLLAGDFAGLEAGASHDFDAETLTEVRACRFQRGAFESFMRDHVDVALRLVHVASNERAQAARHEMLLGRKTALERVATFLADLRARSGERHLRTHPLSLPMTRAEIADYTGLTIETVSRVFGRLRDDRILEMVGTGAVRILDESTLAAMAESGV